MANYKNITQSGVITSKPGKLGGFIVSTFTGTGTLKFWDGTEGGVQATSTLTSTGAYVPAGHATSKITSAGASVAATHATGTLTSDGTQFADGETVTIGTTVYTFKTGALVEPYDVAVGSTLKISLANLKRAINGSRPPVGYNQETPKHTQVVAYSSDATTVVIYANVVGASLNTVATTATCAHASWGGTTLVDGVATTSSTVTIGNKVYTQVNALSETLGAPAVANQFLRGASEATMLDALKAAINGTSVGTLCSTGTVAHPDVIATTNADDAQTIVARWVGDNTETARINAIATTCTMANTAWADTTLGGGTGDSNPAVSTAAAQILINGRTYTFTVELSEASGATAVADQILAGANPAASLANAKKAINASGIAGTDYSTGTTQNVDVLAGATDATTMVITAYDAGTYGNAITTTENMANTAWTSTVMASGTGSRSTPITGTITIPAVTVGPLVWNYAEPISLKRGLYVTVEGTTMDATVEYN